MTKNSGIDKLYRDYIKLNMRGKEKITTVNVYEEAINKDKLEGISIERNETIKACLKRYKNCIKDKNTHSVYTTY